MRIASLITAALLGGCATLPAGTVSAPPPEIRLLTARAETDLRKLVADLADPAVVPPYAETVFALDLARATVATAATFEVGAPEGHARTLLALGVTLGVCREGVVRLAGLERAEATQQARGLFALTCLGPLGVLAAQ